VVVELVLGQLALQAEETQAQEDQEPVVQEHPE
jgi:hypothetical protein